MYYAPYAPNGILILEGMYLCKRLDPTPTLDVRNKGCCGLSQVLKNINTSIIHTSNIPSTSKPSLLLLIPIALLLLESLRM